MLWLLMISCGEEPKPVAIEPLIEIEEEPVVLGKEVQALWAPIEASESKLKRRRFLVWDHNKNGVLDNNTELISVFDTDGAATFTDGYAMLSHYFDSDRDGVLKGNELSKLSLWTDIKTPTLFNRTTLNIGTNIESLTNLGITSIDLQSPTANFPIDEQPLCVLDDVLTAATSLWLPPLAGPIASECDRKIIFCHEPLGITEFITNTGEPLEASHAAKLPFYPMAQPLESCFPGPSQYLDIRFDDGIAAAITEASQTDEPEEAPPPLEEITPTEDIEEQPVTEPLTEQPENIQDPELDTQPITEQSTEDTSITEPSEPSTVIVIPKQVFASTHRFSSDSSILAVQTFNDTTTMGASLAHDHIILARTWSGSIRWHPKDPKQCLIDFRISVKGLDPDPPNLRAKYGLEDELSSDQRDDIKENMLSANQLDAENYPNILFQAYSCDKTEGIVTVMGMLTIRDVEREVRFPMNVDLDDGFHAKGFFSVQHSDFGFEPYSALLGSFRNKPEIKFVFEINSLPVLE